jgi:transposase-like protein
MAQFSDRMVPEVVPVFWAAMARGEFITDAAAEVGTYREKGMRWLRAEGGVRPRRGRDLKGRCLTFAEREEIAVARAGGESMRSIAGRLGRHPSTVSRELSRNAEQNGGYRATTAHALAYGRASRPKPAKLAVNLKLRRVVEEDLCRRYSPEQIVGRLRRQFPDDLRDAGVARDDLPIAVSAVPWRSAARSDQVPTNRPGAAPTVSPGPQAP